jgi:UDP-N-acetylmuramate dehydrogenase
MLSMQQYQDVSLAGYSTMRLGGKAKYAVEVTTRTELEEVVAWATEQTLPMIMVGIGSNIVWRDEGFDGLLIINKLMRYEDFAEDETNHYVTMGSGENWDSVVARTVEAGLTGIEALSLIPGNSGATPVQNVGAYGQDISQTLTSLEAYDTVTKAYVNIPAMDCGFGYRTSRFNGADKGRFFITAITLHLTTGNPQPPFYTSLQKYLDDKKISDYTPVSIRAAVIDIRSHKLPDPAIVANNGSFFANPIVDAGTLAQIQSDYPEVPHWDTNEPGKIKLPAAWLVEQAGFKDFTDVETGMATWPVQALVLVNKNAQSTADLLKFKQKIVDAVANKFAVTLVQEPELLP